MVSAEIAKMDPMVRKLESDLAGFKSALEQEDLVAAQQLLRSINRTSDYLSEDVTEIYKSEERSNASVGPNDMFAGGVPVRQFNETEQVINVAKRDQVLKGTILPARVGGIMKPQSSVGKRL